MSNFNGERDVGCVTFSTICCDCISTVLICTGIILLINSGNVYDTANCGIVPYGEPCINSKADFKCVDDLVAAAKIAGVLSVIPAFNVLFAFSLFPLTSEYFEVRDTQITVFKDSKSEEMITMTCEAFIEIHVPDLLLACEMGLVMSWITLIWWILMCSVACKNALSRSKRSREEAVAV